MEQRALGRSGISVPPSIFGGNVFGWTVDQAMSFRLLDACVERGLVAIDTADVYSAWVPGHQGRRVRDDHRRLAEGAPGNRDKVVIVTKCGMEMPARQEGCRGPGSAGRRGFARAGWGSSVSTSTRRTATTRRRRSRTRSAPSRR